MKLRIVYNAFTRRYRIERKRWWGWSFVTEPGSGSYLGFDSLDSAQQWVKDCFASLEKPSRRWEVVDELAF